MITTYHQKVHEKFSGADESFMRANVQPRRILTNNKSSVRARADEISIKFQLKIFRADVKEVNFWTR